MAEGGGGGADEFDALVLDEDFIRGATVREPSAKDWKRRERAVRRRQGVGPLASTFGPAPAPQAEPRQTLADVDPLPEASAPTTSTTIYHLTRRAYRAGDCVLWDQHPGVDTRATKIVDCAEPHLMEFTAFARAPERVTFPSDNDWNAIVLDVCMPLAVSHIGYVLDPRGRFHEDAGDGSGSGDAVRRWDLPGARRGRQRAPAGALY